MSASRWRTRVSSVFYWSSGKKDSESSKWLQKKTPVVLNLEEMAPTAKGKADSPPPLNAAAKFGLCQTVDFKDPKFLEQAVMAVGRWSCGRRGPTASGCLSSESIADPAGHEQIACSILDPRHPHCVADGATMLLSPAQETRCSRSA